MGHSKTKDDELFTGVIEHTNKKDKFLLEYENGKLVKSMKILTLKQELAILPDGTEREWYTNKQIIE